MRARVAIALLAVLASCKKKRALEVDDCAPSIGVRVSYPGASPREVEQGVLLAVEEAARSVVGVSSIHTLAKEGGGLAEIELVPRANFDVVLGRIKEAIDRVTSFPEAVERPTVSPVRERERLTLAVVPIGFDRGELEAVAGVTAVLGFSGITYEIGVDVDLDKLRSFGVSLDAIASAIRADSIELPGGGIEIPGGRVAIGTSEGRTRHAELGETIVKTTPAGSVVKLADLATIRRRPAETPAAYYKNQRVEVFALDVDKRFDPKALMAAGALAATPPLGLASCPRAWGRQLGAAVGFAESRDAREIATGVAELDALVLAGSDIFDLGSDGVEVVALTDQATAGLARIPGLHVVEPGDAAFIELTGDDIDTLAATSRDLAARLRKNEGVVGVLEQPPPATKPAIDVRLNDAGRKRSLTASAISLAVRRATRGEVAAVFSEGRAEVFVVVRPSGIDSSDLHALPIEVGGRFVPLGSVATISVGQAPAAIYRRDGRRRTHLQVRARSGAAAIARGAAADLPAGITAEVLTAR